MRSLERFILEPLTPWPTQKGFVSDRITFVLFIIVLKNEL